jgi:hypothetical protein
LPGQFVQYNYGTPVSRNFGSMRRAHRPWQGSMKSIDHTQLLTAYRTSCVMSLPNFSTFEGSQGTMDTMGIQDMQIID